jgi:hypothetical protein
LLFTGGCTTRLDVLTIRRPDAPALVRKPAGCPLQVYAKDQSLPEGCREIGDVFVADTGWTYDCGLERVTGIVRNEACSQGADAAQLVTHYDPSISGSTCHEVRFRFLVCEQDAVVTR